MNLTYVWIDSLCIIQDSIEDWTKEAKEMGNVYKHCLVNIAATGFSNGERGFFADRNLEDVCSFEVHSEGSDFLDEGDFHLVWNSKWHDEVLTAPLNTRGWVFQERLFSPHILSFGARELFWECKEREACESYPQEFPATSDAPDGKISEQRALKSRNPLDDLKIVAGKDQKDGQAESGEYIWDFWCTIVELYSGTELTNAKDKLIAISGVVAEVSKLLGSEYLAGLWRVHLLPQLLWEVPQSQYEKVTSQVDPQALSWSWASLNTRVDLRHAVPDLGSEKHTTGLLSTLLSAAVSTDPQGFFMSGELRICGPLMAATIEPDDLHIGSRYMMKLYSIPRLKIYVRYPSGTDHIWIQVLLKPDNVRDWDEVWAPYFQDPVKSTKEHSDRDLAQWPKLMTSHAGFPNTIFLLPLVSRVFQAIGDKTEVEESEKTGFLGLILLPTRNSDGISKRVGMFMSLVTEDTGTENFENVLREKLAISTENY